MISIEIKSIVYKTKHVYQKNTIIISIVELCVKIKCILTIGVLFVVVVFNKLKLCHLQTNMSCTLNIKLYMSYIHIYIYREREIYNIITCRCIKIHTCKS